MAIEIVPVRGDMTIMAVRHERLPMIGTILGILNSGLKLMRFNDCSIKSTTLIVR